MVDDKTVEKVRNGALDEKLKSMARSALIESKSSAWINNARLSLTTAFRITSRVDSWEARDQDSRMYLGIKYDVDSTKTISKSVAYGADTKRSQINYRKGTVERQERSPEQQCYITVSTKAWDREEDKKFSNDPDVTSLETIVPRPTWSMGLNL